MQWTETGIPEVSPQNRLHPFTASRIAFENLLLCGGTRLVLGIPPNRTVHSERVSTQSRRCLKILKFGEHEAGSLVSDTGSEDVSESVPAAQGNNTEFIEVAHVQSNQSATT